MYKQNLFRGRDEAISRAINRLEFLEKLRKNPEKDFWKELELLANQTGRYDMRFFRVLDLTLQVLHEEGFMFSSTEKAYETFKKLYFGARGVLERGYVLIEDAKAGEMARLGAIEDFRSQDWRGLINLYPTKTGKE